MRTNSRGSCSTAPAFINGPNDIVGLMDESGVRVVEYIYKKSPKSIIARKCFDDVGLKVEDDFNKVRVKTSFHRRLHTNIYYGLINTGVLIAYAIGRDKDSKANNIKAFVGTVSNILSSRSRSLKW